MSQSTTAWNEIFVRQGKVFTEPHEDMPRLVKILKEKRADTTILDLGSGTGRHAVYLAKQGFSVFGLDNSPEGIKGTRRWLTEEGAEYLHPVGWTGERLAPSLLQS